MKLYLVESDATGYDQYDAMVIRAADPKSAERLVRTGKRKDTVAHDCVFSYAFGASQDPKPFPGFEPHHMVTVTELSEDGPESIVLACHHPG